TVVAHVFGERTLATL
ncbi:hypothetical protein, partial [Escherichia coli]